MSPQPLRPSPALNPINNSTVAARRRFPLRNKIVAALALGALSSPVLVAQPDTDLETSKSAIVRFRGASDPGLVRRHGGRVGKDLWIINGVAATIPLASWDALAKNPRIASLEIDGVAHATGKPVRGTSVFETQQVPWGVTRVGAPVSGNSGDGVKVAILDSGMGPNADLPTAWKQKDFVNNDSDATDDEGHGTHVAGTIAAQANGIGVVGVAPGVDLMIGKVLNRRGSGSYSDIIAGIQWAAAEGAQVINMSLGGESDSKALHDAISAASMVAVVVVAAGNDAQSGNDVQYPAAYDEVVAVAATTSSDGRASFSSYGYWVDIAGPGTNVLSTLPGDVMGSYNGTSMATPHVAGCAALAFAADAANAAEVHKRLLYWAQDLGAPGWDEQFGAGMVDAVALQKPVPAPAAVDLSVILEGSSSVAVGSALEFTATVHNVGSSSDSQAGTVALYSDKNSNQTLDEGESLIASDRVDVAAGGSQVVDFNINAGGSAGTESYLAIVTADTTDGNPSNNLSASEVEVFDPSQTALLFVSAIDYSETKRDLRIHLTIDDLTSGLVIPGALVEITLNLNGSPIGSASATTDDTGRVVFRLRNAPAGSYTTTVDQVSLAGAIYDPSRNVADPGWER